MKKTVFKSVVTGLLFSIISLQAQAGLLLVEQYDNYWSNNVNSLISYADNNQADSTGLFGEIDFTDDPNGFAGAISGSNPWPSANGQNLGTNHSLNNTFFARITGDFYVDTADTFWFRTFNDDGVFVYIDGELVINDSTLHPEMVFEGSKALSQGNHSVELYFFENGGEASLEFTVADSSRQFAHFNDVNGPVSLNTVAVPEPSTIAIFALGLMGIGARRVLKK